MVVMRLCRDCRLGQEDSRTLSNEPRQRLLWPLPIAFTPVGILRRRPLPYANVCPRTRRDEGIFGRDLQTRFRAPSGSAPTVTPVRCPDTGTRATRRRRPLPGINRDTTSRPDRDSAPMTAGQLSL